jgi:Leucine-rich repeat (LRR) protein
MKTRQNLDQIVKLNLWGNDLGDVSILNSLPNLEILALTVNQIASLKDFQNCSKLRELYLRRNNIPAKITELKYLQNL